LVSPRSRPTLYQVLVRSRGTGGTGGTEPVSIGTFPFVIGRAADVSLHLEGPGIWPRHLRMDLVPEEGLVASVEEGALATLEGKPVARHRLRHGDELTVGSVQIQFLVSPPARRSLSGWEMALWLILVLVLAAQLTVLFGLPHD